MAQPGRCRIAGLADDGNFAAVRALFSDFRYAEVRYTASEDGVSLARFTLMATLADGSQLRAQGCLVVTEHNGLITRIEEYLDGRHLAPLAEAWRRQDWKAPMNVPPTALPLTGTTLGRRRSRSAISGWRCRRRERKWKISPTATPVDGPLRTTQSVKPR